MPNHFHLILSLETENSDRKKIHGLLGTISRYLGISKLWQSAPPPKSVPDSSHLRRQLRYVALNPCRVKLCSDPLEWYWSTYRDLIGASAKPWVDATKVSCAIAYRSKYFPSRFHEYVSGDPSVSVTGTPFPKAALAGPVCVDSLGEILAASASALRAPVPEVRKKGSDLRKLFFHLAARHGWRKPTPLSQIAGITPLGVRLALRQEPPQGIQAAELCLGDARLRKISTTQVLQLLHESARFGLHSNEKR